MGNFWSVKIAIAPLGFVLIMCLPALGQATDSNEPIVTTRLVQGKIPSNLATIVHYRVDTPDSGAHSPTGNLTIEYTDGTKVVEEVTSTQKSTEEGTAFNKVGFNAIQVADDKRTIGWSEIYENGATSYPIPEALAVYSSGERITHIRQGQMLWNWTFLDQARHVAAVWGPTHGTSAGDYQLFDVKTGQLLSEFIKDTEDKSEGLDIPRWVRAADQVLFSQSSR